MQYLQNNNHLNLIKNIEEWASSHSDEQTLYLLIIDGSLFDETEHKSLSGLGFTNRFLLKNTPFGNLKEYGLIGVELSKDNLINNKNGLKQYIDFCSGKPALSIVQLNSLPNNQFWYWLSNLTIEEDTQSFVLRFADTHILPNFLAIANRQTKQNIGYYIKQWAWINRQGKLQIQNIIEDKDKTHLKQPNLDPPLTISSSQLERLLFLSQIDITHAFLKTYEISMPPEKSPYESYLSLQDICQKMNKLHIEKHPDQVYFLSLILTYGNKFYDLPELQNSWQQLQTKKTDFETIKESWGDAILDKINELEAGVRSELQQKYI